MSLAERGRHHRKGESKSHSQTRKEKDHKMAAVMNHALHERRIAAHASDLHSKP